MSSSSSSSVPVGIYGLPHKSRALAAVTGDLENSRFLVATSSLTAENEIHLLHVDATDCSDVRPLAVFHHGAGEVWGLAPCPSDATLFFSVVQSVTTAAAAAGGGGGGGGEVTSTMRAILWKITGHGGDGMQAVTELPGHQGGIKAVLWEPFAADRQLVVTVDDTRLRQWTLGGATATVSVEAPATGPSAAGGKRAPTAAAWDPHLRSQLAVASDCNIRGWDLRANQATFGIEAAHGVHVRDLDWNPHKPYALVSGGDDSKVKFWDTRKTAAPLKTVSDHSHWVSRVQYNRSHDQLVLSAGTDGLVNLWSMESVSSVRREANDGHDGLVRSYEEHDDSVYAIAWSAHDTFSFASLSYGGRVVVTSVPQEETYKILMKGAE